MEQLLAVTVGLGFVPPEHVDMKILFDFLLEQLICAISKDSAILVYDFPICQSSYAQVDAGSPAVAKRFELFYAGMELANGYQEITDPGELQHRLAAENNSRRIRQLAEFPIDQRIISAISQLEPCSGVAVGVDRLLMAVDGVRDIDSVQSFTMQRL